MRRNHTICAEDLPDASFFPTIHDAALHAVASAAKQQQVGVDESTADVGTGGEDNV